MKFRLLATDLDGTLLDRQGRVHASDARAIAELRRRGIVVTICTGRMHSGMHEIAREVGITGPVACVEGSHIHDAESGRELLAAKVTSDAAELLREIVGARRPATFVFMEDHIVHDAAGEPYLDYVKAWTPRLRSVSDVLDAPFGDQAGIAALVAVGSSEQILDAGRRIDTEAAGRLQATRFPVKRGGHDGLWGMIVRAAGATKGTALAWIARSHGVELEETVAIGDWLNDTEMLRSAGRSFAMRQSPDEVKAAATDELDADVDTGGGIAEAARRAGLL